MERPKTTQIRQTPDESFIFRQRTGLINWREIQSLDLDEIIHRGDASKLSELLENITYANIDKTDLERFPDTFVLKLIKLSQFALEFLQEQKTQLESNNKEIEQEKNSILQGSKHLEEQIETHTKKLKILSRDLQNRKKMLSTYENFLLKQPATNAFLNYQIKETTAKCSTCGKIFKNQEYCIKHQQKRHTVGSRPNTAPVAELELMKSTLEDQLKSIKIQQEQEISEFKAQIQQQLIEIKKAKEKAESSIPSQTIPYMQLSSELEKHRKELLEIKYKQRQQEEIMRKKAEEVYRLEQENKRLLRNKEKLLKKMSENKVMDSQKFTKGYGREETHFSYEENMKKRGKIRSESGETNLVHALLNDLVVDRPLTYAAEQSKDEEIFKREIYTPYSERMSPAFKEYEGYNEYIHPLDSPEPQHIIQAAKVLGIDPVKETQYLYLATEFLKSPIPKTWTVAKSEEKTVFKHKETGVMKEAHPGIEFFQELYRSKKIKKDITFDKVRAIIRTPMKKCLSNKYPDGISAFFVPDESTFMTQRMMIAEKVKGALDKMKNISSQQLNKINEEREKIFSEKGDEYRRANETTNSELLTIYSKLR